MNEILIRFLGFFNKILSFNSFYMRFYVFFYDNWATNYHFTNEVRKLKPLIRQKGRLFKEIGQTVTVTWYCEPRVM